MMIASVARWKELHFVMEYMSGGELYKRLSNRKRYTEDGGVLVGNSLGYVVRL